MAEIRADLLIIHGRAASPIFAPASFQLLTIELIRAK